jgi:hypothetical protein
MHRAYWSRSNGFSLFHASLRRELCHRASGSLLPALRMGFDSTSEIVIGPFRLKSISFLFSKGVHAVAIDERGIVFDPSTSAPMNGTCTLEKYLEANHTQGIVRVGCYRVRRQDSWTASSFKKTEQCRLNLMRRPAEFLEWTESRKRSVLLWNRKTGDRGTGWKDAVAYFTLVSA